MTLILMSQSDTLMKCQWVEHSFLRTGDAEPRLQAKDSSKLTLTLHCLKKVWLASPSWGELDEILIVKTNSLYVFATCIHSMPLLLQYSISWRQPSSKCMALRTIAQIRINVGFHTPARNVPMWIFHKKWLLHYVAMLIFINLELIVRKEKSEIFLHP